MISQAITKELRTGCGTIHAVFDEDDKGVFKGLKMFFGRSGSCIHNRIEEYSALINYALSKGGTLEEIADVLKGRQCPSPIVSGGVKVSSCGDAVSHLLKMYTKGKSKEKQGE